MQSLPSDVLVAAFLYAPVSAVGSMAIVSKRFHALISSRVWRLRLAGLPECLYRYVDNSFHQLSFKDCHVAGITHWEGFDSNSFKTLVHGPYITASIAARQIRISEWDLVHEMCSSLPKVSGSLNSALSRQCRELGDLLRDVDHLITVGVDYHSFSAVCGVPSVPSKCTVWAAVVALSSDARLRAWVQAHKPHGGHLPCFLSEDWGEEQQGLQYPTVTEL